MYQAILFAFVLSSSASATPRTLTEETCARVLTSISRDLEDPRVEWAPMPRVTKTELARVKAVGNLVSNVESFLRGLFPGVNPADPERMQRYFEFLWQRLPEFTVDPASFSEVPTPFEIQTEWLRFTSAFFQAPRAMLEGGAPAPESGPEVRIKFKAELRERIARLDLPLRRRIEKTEFEPYAIAKLLARWTSPAELRQVGGAAAGFRKLWLRTLQIPEPAAFRIVESTDGRYLSRAEFPPVAGARLVEQFRLYKMIYNRNRPRAGQAGE